MPAKLRYAALVLAVLASATCGGTSVQSIRTSSRVLPPRPVGAQIDIYRTGQTPDSTTTCVGRGESRDATLLEW